MIPSIRVRPSLPLTSLLAAFVLAGCAVQHDPGTEGESEAKSGALIRCGANQYRECSNEGPGGSLICWCTDNDPPPPAPTADGCKPDTAHPTAPPGLPGCQPGFWVNAAEFFLCPSTTTIPTSIYMTDAVYRTHRVAEWIATTDTSIQPRCSSFDGGVAGGICYYSPSQIPNSCLPTPAAGWVYLVESGDPGGPIGGGVHGPAELFGP